MSISNTIGNGIITDNLGNQTGVDSLTNGVKVQIAGGSLINFEVQDGGVQETVNPSFLNFVKGITPTTSGSGTDINLDANFTDLNDVPSSYTGEGGKAVRVNAGETALEFYTPPVGGNKTVQFGVETSASSGTYRIRNVASTGNFNFNFAIPYDFTNLVSIKAVYVSAFAGGAGKDIDLNSSYGAITESSTLNQESDTTSTFTVPASGIVGAVDLSTVFSALGAGDYCSVNIDHNGIGGALAYLFIELVYN